MSSPTSATKKRPGRKQFPHYLIEHANPDVVRAAARIANEHRIGTVVTLRDMANIPRGVVLRATEAQVINIFGNPRVQDELRQTAQGQPPASYHKQRKPAKRNKAIAGHGGESDLQGEVRESRRDDPSDERPASCDEGRK